VSIGTTVLSAIVGTAAAYFGGMTERIILLIIHFLMVVPTFLILALISSNAGGDWRVISLVMIFVGWFFPARVIWTMALSLREREYVQAARYMGVPGMTIVLRHLLPNIGSLLVINFTLGVVGAVISETGLSFIGFGVKIPDVSLGSLIGIGANSVSSAPWTFYFPALALTMLTVSMALIADGLRDALDPTSAAGGRA
jgi:peptide/nickel transport system permease protein